MKIQVLIDNLKSAGESCEVLQPEWGLSAFIEFNGKRILLDTGASAAFAANAGAMKVDLSTVDVGVLSHAHFDHSNGMEKFFEANSHAPFYLRESAGENCYHTHKFLKFFTYQEYIGIRRGWLKRYAGRIKFASGTAEILPGVFLVGHNDFVFSAEDRAEIAARNGLSVKVNGKYRPDSFNHEQSLVFDTPRGLFIMNSCSHGGADNIVKEIEVAFPGKKIYAMLGGFHLYRTSDSQVRAFAERLRELDVQKIYTGHCTGDHAYEILHEVLGDRAEQMYTGMEIEV
ncbi:MBL fold metallo-hydrolase [Fibrobacter sp. UWEL]|uniref:MBL fold metallo-hydrolase n=1 Tax=Fibrobacter sp. UWEL TaxID=1896209 RepID=UPI000917C6BC|nr:MBL fold metallo-hydrolase [Fibrobacter sp. UWEL]SHK95072.1 7,8-dihydropterin-6-yl-methyl-4-(beta-D-ribofuranosyl)aminobenzene 5'-phosphate synthase [Fibrobacter sp. UWEL]